MPTMDSSCLQNMLASFCRMRIIQTILYPFFCSSRGVNWHDPTLSLMQIYRIKIHLSEQNHIRFNSSVCWRIFSFFSHLMIWMLTMQVLQIICICLLNELKLHVLRKTFSAHLTLFLQDAGAEFFD